MRWRPTSRKHAPAAAHGHHRQRRPGGDNPPARGEAALRLSLRDKEGREIDSAIATDPKDAVHEAAMLLVRRSGLYVGDLLSIDDDVMPAPEPDAALAVSAASLGGLAGRLERRAGVLAPGQPLSSHDLRTAARFIRHGLRIGWVGETGIMM
jgi:hypothetical protein